MRIGSEFAAALTPTEPSPEILCAVATLGREPPPDPKVYAEIIGNMVDKELMNGFPVGFQVFAFKGLQVQHWILNGEFPFPLDDMIRAIAALGPAEAIGVRHPAVAEIDGESFRAITCAVECAGRRHDRVLALKLGPNGKPTAMRAFHHDLGPLPPEGLWLGVPPKNADVTLFLMAPAGSEPNEA